MIVVVSAVDDLPVLRGVADNLLRTRVISLALGGSWAQTLPRQDWQSGLSP